VDWNDVRARIEAMRPAILPGEPSHGGPAGLLHLAGLVDERRVPPAHVSCMAGIS